MAAEAPERYGTPALCAPRLGQGIFRVKVLDAYGRSCAVSHEHSLPRIPLEKPEADSAPLSTLRPDRGAKRVLRVLLIEDNVDAAESLKEALALNGHEVETAATGLDGLAKARAFHPDVVLCDIGLPGIDGFEVARRMRGDPVLRAACLIALSSYAAPEDLERSKEAGFVQHVAQLPDLAALEMAMREGCGPSPSGWPPS